MTIESRLVGAHVKLEVTPKDERGVKTVSVVRYGVYDVRLIDFNQTCSSNAFAFWLELFDHGKKVAIDSGGSNDLEEAVTLAEELISRAEELSKKG